MTSSLISMKTLSRLVVGLVVAELLLVVLSWLFSATLTADVRPLLSSEGVRWFFAHFVDGLSSPLLVWIILLAIVLLLAGLLYWSSVTMIESYVSGTAEVKGGVMNIRFDDQQFAKNVETGMKVTAGNTETSIASVGRDANGLYIATAHTALSDGFYPVQVSYKQTQILQLLFD